MSDLLTASKKISDSDLRNGTREWLYFRQASAATVANLAEAERLTGKVEAHEQKPFFMPSSRERSRQTRINKHTRKKSSTWQSPKLTKQSRLYLPPALLLTASNLYATMGSRPIDFGSGRGYRPRQSYR
jgi:hypothetical protein